MNVFIIGFCSFILVIGVYEIRTGKIPGGEIKWLNTPVKVRISAAIFLIISIYYLFTNMASTGMEFMSLVVGGICGLMMTSNKKHQDKRKR